MFTDAASTPTYKEKHMAISTIQPGRYYDVNRDEYYDSHAQYMRHMEHLRIEQMRADDRQRNMYAAQQQMAHSPFSGTVQGAAIGTLQSTHDPKDPLSFLSRADNKLLLTGEAS